MQPATVCMEVVAVQRSACASDGHCSFCAKNPGAAKCIERDARRSSLVSGDQMRDGRCPTNWVARRTLSPTFRPRLIPESSGDAFQSVESPSCSRRLLAFIAISAVHSPSRAPSARAGRRAVVDTTEPIINGSRDTGTRRSLALTMTSQAPAAGTSTRAARARWCRSIRRRIGYVLTAALHDQGDLRLHHAGQRQRRAPRSSRTGSSITTSTELQRRDHLAVRHSTMIRVIGRREHARRADAGPDNLVQGQTLVRPSAGHDHPIPTSRRTRVRTCLKNRIDGTVSGLSRDRGRRPLRQQRRHLPRRQRRPRLITVGGKGTSRRSHSLRLQAVRQRRLHRRAS